MRTVHDDVLGTPFSHSRWGMRRPYLSLSESKDVETRFYRDGRQRGQYRDQRKKVIHR